MAIRRDRGELDFRRRQVSARSLARRIFLRGGFLRGFSVRYGARGLRVLRGETALFRRHLQVQIADNGGVLVTDERQDFRGGRANLFQRWLRRSSAAELILGE